MRLCLLLHHVISSAKSIIMSEDTDFFRWNITIIFCCDIFGHWNISVICLTVAWKLAVTVFSSLNFQTFWPKWLNFFRSFHKRFRSMTEKKQLLRRVLIMLLLRNKWPKSLSEKQNTDSNYFCQIVVRLFLYVVRHFVGALSYCSSAVYDVLPLPAALLLFIWSTAANELELYLWDTFN